MATYKEIKGVTVQTRDEELKQQGYVLEVTEDLHQGMSPNNAPQNFFTGTEEYDGMPLD